MRESVCRTVCPGNVRSATSQRPSAANCQPMRRALVSDWILEIRLESGSSIARDIGPWRCGSLSRRYRRKPLRMSSVSSPCSSEEVLLQCQRDGAWPPGADAAAIELTYGNHFGGGAGKEGLIGAVDLIARDPLLGDGQTTVACQRTDRIPSDSLEYVGGLGCEKSSVSNYEEVFSGALRRITLSVEHESLVVPVAQRLVVGHHRIEVMARRLGMDHHRIDVVAGER